MELTQHQPIDDLTKTCEIISASEDLLIRIVNSLTEVNKKLNSLHSNFISTNQKFNQVQSKLDAILKEVSWSQEETDSEDEMEEEDLPPKKIQKKI